jgi:hypothetical protein
MVIAVRLWSLFRGLTVFSVKHNFSKLLLRPILFVLRSCKNIMYHATNERS